MREGFFVHRKVVMNDMLNFRYIQPTGSEVRRDKHMTTTVTEFIQSTFTVRLLHATMKTFGK